MTYTLVIDLLVAFLLVVTIGYAMILNKKLAVLRQDKAELEKLAKIFGDSTDKANDSIHALKITTNSLEERVAKAESLHNDLSFLIERGNSTADRLEDRVRSARNSSAHSDTTNEPKRNVSEAPKLKPRPRSEETKVGVETREDLSLSEIENKVAKELSGLFKDDDAATDQQPRKAPQVSQSDAELELLKALRSSG